MEAYKMLYLIRDLAKNAVMQYYDVEAGTEDAAWLQGYIMRLIVKAMKEDGTI